MKGGEQGVIAWGSISCCSVHMLAVMLCIEATLD